MKSKKILYELITTGWELAKFYFGKDMNTAAEYEEFTQNANNLLKKISAEYGTIGKEYKFACKFFSAVNEYCDQDWRETHQGIQTSLFGKGS